MKMNSAKFNIACSIAGIFLMFSLSSCSLNLNQSAEVEEKADPLSQELQPNAGLSPDQVIKIQVEALQNNDDEDNGIEVTFRFASPANKNVTGPLARFKRMVKNPAYSPMLNHKLAEYGPLEIEGDIASQRVTIIGSNGEAIVYQFTLSKQSGPPCAGCWMTDSVIIVPTQRQNLEGA